MAKDAVKTGEDSTTLDEGGCEERQFIGIWVRGRGTRGTQKGIPTVSRCRLHI